MAKIKYNSDIYRKLFANTKEESNEIEEEIKHKKKVLTKEPGRGMGTRQRIPGERKLQK